MENLLVSGGRLAGVVGVLLCVVAVIWRLLGHYALIGFEVGTLLLGGTAAVAIGCFMLLLARVDRR